jgi:hypothetical protein
MRQHPIDDIAVGQLTHTEYRNRVLVAEHGRAGAERIAREGRLRFQRQLLREATVAVVRHLRAGTIATEWGARCRLTLRHAREQYQEARARLDAINGRLMAAE